KVCVCFSSAHARVFGFDVSAHAKHKKSGCSTGGYPWSIDGTSSTMVYIKNASDHQQHYVARLTSVGGTYIIGQKAIEASQTVKFDIRALRDNQVPDENGHAIPLTAVQGSFKWSLIQASDAEEFVMIGRAEQVDIVRGISSSYACQNC